MLNGEEKSYAYKRRDGANDSIFLGLYIDIRGRIVIYIILRE